MAWWVHHFIRLSSYLDAPSVGVRQLLCRPIIEPLWTGVTSFPRPQDVPSRNETLLAGSVRFQKPVVTVQWEALTCYLFAMLNADSDNFFSQLNCLLHVPFTVSFTDEYILCSSIIQPHPDGNNFNDFCSHNRHRAIKSGNTHECCLWLGFALFCMDTMMLHLVFI